MAKAGKLCYVTMQQVFTTASEQENAQLVVLYDKRSIIFFICVMTCQQKIYILFTNK